MYKKLLALLLLLPVSCLMAFIDEPYHETAFIGPANTFYGLTYFSYYKTDHFWNKQGKKLPTFNTFSRKSYRLDMEYDINCLNAVFLQGGYTMVDESLNGRSRGIEDLETSWQHLFYRKGCSAFSGKATLIIPIGPKKSCVRYGQWGGELKILYSRLFNLLQRCCWYDLGLGYRIYSGFPSDQVRANLSIGCNLMPYVWLINTTRLDYGVFNGRAKANPNNICFNPNYRLLETQIEGLIQVYKYVLVTAGGYFHLWGENIGAGGGFYSGLWITF
jgi:hypothetical protein